MARTPRILVSLSVGESFFVDHFDFAGWRRCDVVVNANFGQLYSFRIRFFSRNAEVQDVPGIVPINQYSSVGSACRFDDRQD